MLHELRRAGFDPAWQRVETEADYLTCLSDRLDVILADHTMPEFDSSRALRLLQERALDIPLIVVTGSINEETAVACIKRGAADYLLKDRLARLGPAVTQALREKRVRDEKRQAEATAQEEAQVSAALALVGSELITLRDAQTICTRLCQLTTEVLRCDCSHAFLWQPRTETYTPVAGYGDTPEQWEAVRALSIPRPELASLLVRLESGEEAAQDQLLPAAVSTWFGATESLWVTLRRGDETIGFLTAGYRGHTTPFTTVQQRIARGVAQMASLALENARLLAELEQANRLKSDFLATMSHELRTPLNIIMGYTDLLHDGDFGPVTAEQANALQRVDKSARELLDLIVALLDVSRLEAGRPPLEVTTVRVEELIAELKQETEGGGEKPGLHFTWQVASALPPLHTDRMKLKVILKNLLSNAVKFTDAGSITVDARPHDNGVEISVADTGIGMAPDALPVIFEMFKQADSSMSHRYSGAGLGLYIARRLLELLGGTIAVESEVGQGSTFRVWLPQQCPHVHSTSKPGDDQP